LHAGSQLVRYIGIALGGHPAQALAGRLLLPVSKDTFLRSVRAKTEEAAAEPRAVGIDDLSTTGRGARDSDMAR